MGNISRSPIKFLSSLILEQRVPRAIQEELWHLPYISPSHLADTENGLLHSNLKKFINCYLAKAFDLPYYFKIIWERPHFCVYGCSQDGILRAKSKASIQCMNCVWFGTMLLRHHLPLRFEPTYTDFWDMWWCKTDKHGTFRWTKDFCGQVLKQTDSNVNW